MQLTDTLARSDHWNDKTVTSRRCSNICRLHSYSWRSAWLTSMTEFHCLSDSRAFNKGRLMASGHLPINSLICTCKRVHKTKMIHSTTIRVRIENHFNISSHNTSIYLTENHRVSKSHYNHNIVAHHYVQTDSNYSVIKFYHTTFT